MDKVTSCDVCDYQLTTEEIEKNITLCPQCHAPLFVKALSEFGSEEIDLAIHSLMHILSKHRFDYLNKKLSGNIKKISKREEYWLKKWTNLYWLRPGNAVARALQCITIENAGIDLPDPMLDLGGGDGIFTAALRGYDFIPEFDMYRSLDLKSKDIYDFYEPGAYKNVITNAGKEIDSLLDIRSALVNKAGELGAFGSCITGDARRTPYDDNYFKSIFTNILDYFFDEDFDSVFKEIQRILSSDGQLLTVVQTDKQINGMFYGPKGARLKKEGNTEFSDLHFSLDRGRAGISEGKQENYLNLSKDAWVEKFESSGFEVLGIYNGMSPMIVNLWDTELRPFSVQLIKLADLLDGAGFKQNIKAKVVSFLSKYYEMYVSDFHELDIDEAGAIIIHARKK